jgi:hypothetical protein
MRSSGQNDMVGVGRGVAQSPTSISGGPRLKTFSFTLGKRTEQIPYSKELAAVVYALKRIQP